MSNQIDGHLVIVMAPTGSGKGTLIKSALDKFPELYLSVSCTTRARRPGEINGRDYYFISQAEFAHKVEQGEFIEWVTYGQSMYGTLRSEILPRLRAGKVLLIEIELQGVEQLLSLLPRENVSLIYIDAGNWELLKRRALARAPISESELAKRYERYLVEREAKSLADIVIDNQEQNLEQAKENFCQAISNIFDKIKK